MVVDELEGKKKKKKKKGGHLTPAPGHTVLMCFVNSVLIADYIYIYIYMSHV